MRISVVAHHAPLREGSAAGRQLAAWGQAARDLGHDLRVVCWQPLEPHDLPLWATWRPLPSAPRWRVRAEALVRPRGDSARLLPGFEDGTVLADDPESWAAVAAHSAAAVGVHYAVDLDRRALADRSLARLQDRRGERRAVREAGQVLTFSKRVRDAIGRGVVVPATVPLPAVPVDVLEAPVAGLLADWSWAPNLAAADALLRAWPQVRARVPGARLLLAGRGTSPVGTLAGVEWLGEVRRSSDLLAQVGLFTFPCPDTSGPKMKTLDALAHGVPVLTTPAGAEGVHPGDGLEPSGSADLAERLVALLSDPQERSRRASAAREAMVRHHGPSVAAQARIDALSAATGH